MHLKKRGRLGSYPPFSAWLHPRGSLHLAGVGLQVGAMILHLSAGAALLVERVGDGSRGLNSSATPVFLERFGTDGTPLGTLILPLRHPRPQAPPYNLMESGSSTSDGQLTRSVNGVFVQVPGYNATNTEPSITSSSTNPVLRTIGLVNSAGVVDTSRAVAMLESNNFRSVVSVDGTSFWAAGQPGLVYVSGDSVTRIVDRNFRVVNIFNGQLYCSMGGSSGPGLYSIGSGLPTTPVLPYLVLYVPGVSASPFAFQMNTAGNVCFIADDRTNSGVMKFTYTGGSWVSNYTLVTGSGYGARGLTVDWSWPGVPVIYATTAEDSTNRLVRIVDTGVGSTVTTLATAAARTVFRGVDFLPMPAVWRPANGGNWSAGGTTPWSNWSVGLANDINLAFQNVNSGASALYLPVTNNTSFARFSSLSFTAAGYGGTAGTSYILRGNSFNLLGGIVTDSPLTQTIKLPLTLTESQTFDIAGGGLIIDGVLSGNVPLTKTGAGALALRATNRFIGSLTVNQGTLALYGVLTNSFLNIVNGRLKGTGVVDGPVLIQSSGILEPGISAIGTLTIRGALTLQGTTTMELTKSGTNCSSDVIAGVTALNCGGTLNASFAGTPLVTGDTFTLFRAGSYAGSFASANLPPLGAGLYWDTSSLSTAGTIRVAAVAPPELHGLVTYWDGTVELSCSGTPWMTYSVWATFDPSLAPVESTWAFLGSGMFDATGSAVFYDWNAMWWYPLRFYAVSIP